MKIRTLVLFIICVSLASLLVAEDTTMITGRERREQATSAVIEWDDWYTLTLPGMDEVLVASKMFNYDIGSWKGLEADVDIYYPPDYKFKSKLIVNRSFIDLYRPMSICSLKFVAM